MNLISRKFIVSLIGLVEIGVLVGIGKISGMEFVYGFCAIIGLYSAGNAAEHFLNGRKKDAGRT